MTVTSAVLRALPLTFLVFVVEALCSVYAALPLSLELAHRPELRAGSAFDRAALLSLPLDLAPAFRMASSQALLAGCALLLLSPWLHMSWLAALDRARTPLDALIEGAHHTLRAWLVSLLVSLVALTLALPFALLAYLLHRVLASAADPRLHDLSLLASLSPLVLILPFCCTLHDLARAQALRVSALNSVRVGLRAALRPSMQLRALAVFALGNALVLVSHVLAARLDIAGSGSLVTVALLQSALFARVALRSSWLAAALTCARSPNGPVVAASEREVANERIRQE